MRRDRANYKSTKNTRYATNGSGAIVAKTDRDDKEDISDSAVWWLDDVVTNLSSAVDTTLPTTKAVVDAIYAGSTHERGSWNTLNTIPNNGSGTASAVVKFDRWIVPAGGWTYLGNFHPKWTTIEAMVNGASTYDDFKIIM